MTDKTICIDNILEACVTALLCPRGSFYPDKNYGSQLKSTTLRNADALLAYARQSVSDIDGVYVKGVSLEGDAADFTLLINGEQRQVNIAL